MRWWWHWFDGWYGNGNVGHPMPGTVSSVPEIDASTGMLAIAAVVAILALAWERRRLRA